ncbi:MAG: head-tail adaptor protein [bacterium]|nr:head-tail adaptor protein [bacterium]
MSNALTTQLRHRVRVQKKILAKDNFGGYEENWEDNLTLWAWVHPLKTGLSSPHASENRAQGGYPSAHPRYRVRFRYGVSIPPGSRFLWEGRRLILVSAPVVDFHRRWVDYYAQELREDPINDVV